MHRSVTTSLVGLEPRLLAGQALTIPYLWPFINPRAPPTGGPQKTQTSPTLGSPLLKYLTHFIFQILEGRNSLNSPGVNWLTM